MTDNTHNTKVWHDQNTGNLHVASGGLIVLEPGGSIQTLAGTNLMGSSAPFVQHKQVADVSAESTYYMIAEQAGLITKLKAIMDGAVGTADATATFSINGVPITTGVITMPTAASAAGDILSAVPTAANTVAVGDKISFVITGGGSGGTPRGDFYVEITPQ